MLGWAYFYNKRRTSIADTNKDILTLLFKTMDVKTYCLLQICTCVIFTNNVWIIYGQRHICSTKIYCFLAKITCDICMYKKTQWITRGKVEKYNSAAHTSSNNLKQTWMIGVYCMGKSKSSLLIIASPLLNTWCWKFLQVGY